MFDVYWMDGTGDKTGVPSLRIFSLARCILLYAGRARFLQPVPARLLVAVKHKQTHAQ